MDAKYGWNVGVAVHTRMFVEQHIAIGLWPCLLGMFGVFFLKRGEIKTFVGLGIVSIYARLSILRAGNTSTCNPLF